MEILKENFAQIQRAEVSLSRATPDERDVLGAIRRTGAALAAEISSRERQKALHVALVAALVSAVVAALAIAYANAGRLRRKILLTRGYRWIFAVGRPIHVVDVHSTGTIHSWAYRAASTLSSGGSVGSECSQEDIEAALVAFAGWVSGTDVMFEVDKASFAKPWNGSMKPKWSAGKQATVAGQIVGGIPFVVPLQDTGNLTFAAIACYRALHVSAILPNVDMEVAAATGIFKRWGALLLTNDMGTAGCTATCLDLRRALQFADIVHVAAHATPAQIELSDGSFSASDAESLGRSLRCRFLLLSACDTAGVIAPSNSLVYQFVLNGVTVVASQRPVSDTVCREFFTALYKNFLPNAPGDQIELSQAIRKSAIHCQNRFIHNGTSSGQATADWGQTVDSFVLFGNPSIHLTARRS